MTHLFSKLMVSILAAIFFFIACTQNIGPNPYNCSNTKGHLLVKSFNKKILSDFSVTDTIGDSIFYGFNTNLPLNVDSVEIRKGSPSDTVGSLILMLKEKDIQSLKSIDTVWNSLQLTDTGTIYLKCKAYLICGLKLSATTSVTVLPRPANNPPKLLVPRLINLHPGDSCTLGVLASDADNFQTLTISSVKIPAGSSFDPQSHIFFWKIPGFFTGVDSVVLKVQDNGYPPLFDQKTVYLNVQTNLINYKPVLSVRGMRNVRPADTCTLVVNASDPDSLQTVTLSMLSGPKGAGLKDSIFTWAPPAMFIVTDSAIFMARDDGLPPQSDTIKVYINVASNIPVPSRPEGFKITSRVNGWVILNWKSSGVADFYTVFRYSMKHGPTFIAVDTVYDTLYKDFIGPMNCQYYVKAYNRSGESPSSDTVVSLNSNLPPQWQKDTVNLLGTVGEALTLTASTICLDPNGDTIIFSLLAGQPFGDTLIKGVYSFTPNASDTGTFWPRIVAKDPQGLSDTLTMHLTVSAAAPTNHKPMLTIKGARNIKLGTTCTLTASATDPDSNQTLSYSVTRKPAGSTFNVGTGVFTWTTPASFRGMDTAIFIVVDNGVPPMSDTMCVPILVSDTIINHPPKWQIDTIVLSAAVGNSLTLTLSGKCSDPDGDKLVFNLLSGKPDNDTVKTDVYSFTPANSDTGVFFPRIVAKDSAGLADTLTLRLSVTDGDRKPPYLKLVSPASDSVTVGASSVTVKVVCKDSSGIALLKCAMGTDTFSVSHSDSIYTAAVSGLKSTNMNEVLFIATDASANTNRDTLKVHIKYDPTMLDSIGPTISQVSGPASGVIISDPLVTIVDSIQDPSGIDSVYWTLNQGIIKQLTKVSGKTGQYSLTETIVREKLDTIVIVAVDKATKRNRTIQTFVLNYIIAPQITTHPASKTVCAGSQTIFTVTATGTTPLTYQWRTGVTTFTPIGANNPLCTLNNTSTTILSCVVTNSASVNAVSHLCTLTVNSNSTDPTGITGGSSVCSGGPLTLTVSGGLLGTNAVWKWYTDAQFSHPAGTGVSITVSPTSNTTYYVRAEGPCGNSAAVNVLVNFNSASIAPSGVTASPPGICSGGSSTLTVSGGSLGTGAVWKWYLDQNCSTPVPGGNIGSPLIVSPTIATTYYVRAEGTCGNSAPVNVSVAMNSIPVTPTGASALPTSVCPGSSTSLTVNGGNSGTGGVWKWYTNQECTTPVSGNNVGSPLTVTQTSVTTYYVRAEATCGNSATASVAVGIKTSSSAPSSASASQPTICSGSSTSLSVSGGTLGTGAAWKWYTNAGCTTPVSGINIGTPLTVSPTSSTTYYVRAEGDCGNTAAANVSVTVNSAPVISASPQSQNATAGSTISLNVTASDPNGLIYQWKLNGVNLSDNVNYIGTKNFALQISNISSNQAGTYTCDVTNAYWCSVTTPPAVLTVTSH